MDLLTLTIRYETTDLETQVNTIRAQELRRRASVVTTSGNPNAAALGAQKMRNSNGSRVSVSGHCKAGNWYYKNQSICRDYIAAQQNAGAQLQATNLLNEAAALRCRYSGSNEGQTCAYAEPLFWV